jgi:hypothetical protein
VVDRFLGMEEAAGSIPAQSISFERFLTDHQSLFKKTSKSGPLDHFVMIPTHF